VEGTKPEQRNNKCPSHEVPQRPNQAYTIRDRISVYWQNAFILDMAADQAQFWTTFTLASYYTGETQDIDGL